MVTKMDFENKKKVVLFFHGCTQDIIHLKQENKKKTKAKKKKREKGRNQKKV